MNSARGSAVAGTAMAGQAGALRDARDADRFWIAAALCRLRNYLFLSAGIRCQSPLSYCYRNQATGGIPQANEGRMTQVDLPALSHEMRAGPRSVISTTTLRP